MLLEFVLGMNNLAAGGTPGGTSKAAGGKPNSTSKAAGGTHSGTSEAPGGTPCGTTKKGLLPKSNSPFHVFCAMLSL